MKEWRIEDLVANGHFLIETPEIAHQQACVDTPMKEKRNIFASFGVSKRCNSRKALGH